MKDDIKEMMEKAEEEGSSLIIVYDNGEDLTRGSVINKPSFKRLYEIIGGYFYEH